MNRADPNLAKVEVIAHRLGPLCAELVFVGGCAAGLLLTDAAAPLARVTYDVDLVAEVAALRAYHALEEEFSRLGFVRDVSPDAPICRWRCGEVEVDLMPSDPGILGFANRWYPLAIATAQAVALPAGGMIRLVNAPLFLATKFEAYADRGGEDPLGSHDLEDILNVVDGRPELINEIAASAGEVKAYLAGRCQSLLGLPHFLNYLPGLLAQDEALEIRVATVAERLRTIVSLHQP